MTNISVSPVAVQKTTASTSEPSGSDTASKIVRITKQIIKLTEKIKDIADGEGSAKDKMKQAKLLQDQITMLQEQLAQLQQKQAEENQPSSSVATITVTKDGNTDPIKATVTSKTAGDSSSSDENQIDIYV